MIEQKFFPASIVDEGVYITEAAAKFPLTFHFLLTLEGEVSYEAVRKALDASLDLYPKFRCVLARNYPSVKRWFRYCWEYRDLGSKDILTEIENFDPQHNSQEALDYFMENHYAPSLDPTREVPLRITIIRQIDRVILVFLFHHVAVDGIGALLFIQSFVRLYEDIFYGKNEKGSYTPNPASISQPNIKMPLSRFSFRLFCNYLKYTYTLLRVAPVRLKAKGGQCSSGRVVSLCREISQDHLKGMREAAKRYEVYLNDYLLCALFQTIKKWNQKETEESGRICINIPVNLRDAKDQHTVGNLLSGFNLFLKSESINGKREMLKMIWKERFSLVANGVLQTTRDLTWFLKPIPLRLKRTLSEYNVRKSFSPTISLSNLGVYAPNSLHSDEEGFHYLGDARISRIIPVALALPWPNAGYVIYNERMIIYLTGFCSYLSPEAARDFLDCFIQQLSDKD